MSGYDQAARQQVNETRRDQGKTNATRANGVAVLKARFGRRLPPIITRAIQEEEDLATLEDWLTAAVKAESLDGFRQYLR